MLKYLKKSKTILKIEIERLSSLAINLAQTKDFNNHRSL